MDGEELGKSEGDAVGLEDGTSLGENDGACVVVGCDEGPSLGTSVGADDIVGFVYSLMAKEEGEYYMILQTLMNFVKINQSYLGRGSSRWSN